MDYNDYIDFVNHLFLAFAEDSKFMAVVLTAESAATIDALTIIE